MFGGMFSSYLPERGNVVFQGGVPSTFVHAIEWWSPYFARITNFSLFLAGDDSSGGHPGQRSIASVRLYAFNDAAKTFNLIYAQSAIQPYSYLVISSGVPEVVSRRWRAEFTQDSINPGADGPRILELDGFGTTIPVPEPSNIDLWDVSNGSTVTFCTSLNNSGSDPRDMFGGMFGPYLPERGNVVFQDQVPSTFVHAIEWQTPYLAVITNFNLFLDGDDDPLHLGERSIASFNLYAFDGSSLRPLFSTNGIQPYMGLEVLSGCGLPAIASSRWRAEFTQQSINPVADGPRILELDGFGAVVSPVSNPTIVRQPLSQLATVGANITVHILAAGISPLSYQWRFNGLNIAGATDAALVLKSVTAANSGGYSVMVWNSAGSILSDTASLAVLTEGANGTQPSQRVCSSAPSPSSQVSLVVVTHGFLPSLTGPPPMPAWVTTLANCIQADAPSWSVTALDWRDSAWGINPELALTTGGIVGSLYGQQLAQKQWQRVHLIGHSAGSAVIQAIADQLRSSPSPPVIQMTFLDPYLGMFLEESGFYGQNANWADCYFTQDRTGGFTSGNVSHAYNVDVDWADPNRWLVDYGSSQVAFSTHEYSHDFYIKSVTNTDPEWCGKDYGFRLSAEGGGEANQASHPVGNGGNPTVLCGPPGSIPSPNLPWTVIKVSLGSAAHAVSQFGTTLIGDAGAWLSSVSSRIHPKDGGGGTATNGPAWLAVAVTITNPVNFVQFDAGFTDTNSAEGLLTVYFNTNQIGMVDERVAPPALSTYRFALPATLTSGSYTLSFRLDVFTNAESSITVTNVATGFVGITQPISLAMLLMDSNNTPVLELTAAPGYNYLVQSSTNLVDWLPTALLANTNGTVLFADPALTNRGARFYRAMMP